MELYPICDESFQIFPNIWYVISGNGEVPFMRVGHTIAHIKTGNNEDKGKLYLIGGANPSGCFNDIHTFDLNTLLWEKLDESKALRVARYEHSCFVDNYSNPNQIFIFGGASQEDNLNDLCCFDLSNKTWSDLKASKGNRPSPRTQHVGCVFREQLVVFGGGQAGSQPVNDQQVYMYNQSNDTWNVLNIKSSGQLPPDRHGHLMINYNDKSIYMHGGMNGQKFYNDLWILDIDALNWVKVKQQKTNIPCARASHGGVSTSRNLYIFGGLSEQACALSDFWSYNVETNVWSIITSNGDNPPSRLDFAFCKVTLNKIEDNKQDQASALIHKTDENGNSDTPKLISVFDVAQSEDSQVKEDTRFVVNNSSINVESSTEQQSNGNETICNKESVNVNLDKLDLSDQMNQTMNDINDQQRHFMIIHGGMDTEGNIFDDCFIINLN